MTIPLHPLSRGFRSCGRQLRPPPQTFTQFPRDENLTFSNLKMYFKALYFQSTIIQIFIPEKRYSEEKCRKRSPIKLMKAANRYGVQLNFNIKEGNDKIKGNEPAYKQVWSLLGQRSY